MIWSQWSLVNVMVTNEKVYKEKQESACWADVCLVVMDDGKLSEKGR